MDPLAERDLTDMKIAVPEARADAKFAGVSGKLDLVSVAVAELSGKIDLQRAEGSSNRNIMVTTSIGSVLAIAALIVGMLSYGRRGFTTVP